MLTTASSANSSTTLLFSPRIFRHNISCCLHIASRAQTCFRARAVAIEESGPLYEDLVGTSFGSIRIICLCLRHSCTWLGQATNQALFLDKEYNGAHAAPAPN